VQHNMEQFCAHPSGQRGVNEWGCTIENCYVAPSMDPICNVHPSPRNGNTLCIDWKRSINIQAKLTQWRGCTVNIVHGFVVAIGSLVDSAIPFVHGFEQFERRSHLGAQLEYVTFCATTSGFVWWQTVLCNDKW